MSDIKRLNDEAAVRALSRAGVIYAQRHELDSKTLAKTVQAMVAVEGAAADLPSWAHAGAAADLQEAAPVARRALQAMLDSPPAEGLHAAAADAMAAELAGKPQLVEWIAGGGILLTLAVLSKWSYSAEKGHRFESGFPDLDKVLGKVGAIIGKLG